MTLTTVDSSMILAVGYDDDSQEMEVVFPSGRIYRYREVPREVFDELLAAESKGSYMHSAVIDCYPYYQVRSRRRRY